MTFNAARRIATERFNEVLVYLNHITTLEPPAGQPVPQEVKIMRGLFYVQLYGALEKATNDSLQNLLSKIGGLQPKNCHVTLPFNVISMSKQWKSLKDSGYKNALCRVREFFLAVEENKFHGIDESLFADIVQNIWAKTIDDIILALGITGFALSVSDRALVDELVEKRNAIAHGRESPSSIGERDRCEDLRRRLNQVQTLVTNLIDRFENYFNAREFVYAAHQAHYQ
ncbi:MAE_28990/MAE_18760 family HEPN-like nuclease [Zoogloea sp.]|uniref:MAE_28990/MAE_18760 family HEPN-like nuclease n=1 Tax=Zoogloea sp. TaxID=49181 RepID=UPI0035AF0E2B